MLNMGRKSETAAFPCLLWGLKMGNMATKLEPSWGSPLLSAGEKSEMTA